MKSRSYQLAAKAGGLVGGFLAMAAIGWNLSGGPSEPVAKKPAPSDTRPSRERPPRRSGPRDAAAAKMAVVRNSGTSADRLRATIALANSLPVSAFGDWLSGAWFTLREGPEFTLFTQILRERWLREDPEGFILWSMKNDPEETSSLLATWTESEPRKFLDFFKRHPADKNFELQALAGFARNHPDLALRRLLEMDGEGPSDRVDYFANDLFQALAEKSPAAFEAALDSLREPMKSQAGKILITQQFKTDYEGELRKLFERHDGFEVYANTAGAMSGRIMDYLDDLPPDWRKMIPHYCLDLVNPDNAEEWWNADLAAAGFSEREINTLQIATLQQMAVKNPETALKLMESLDFPPQEGDGDGFRRRAGIIAKALSGNPGKTEEIIASLTSEKQRELARRSLAGISEENARNAARQVETPEQWLKNVTAADFQAGFEYRGMLNGWGPEKLAALGEQFQLLPDEQKQRIAKVVSGSVDDYYAHPPALVGDAIRYLLMHPPAGSSGDAAPQNVPGSATASRYAARLATSEPEAATAWVASLPEGQPKLWATKNLLLNWSEYDPNAAEGWLKSLSPVTQAEIKKLGKQPSK
jgi:hypothetical protein